MGLQDRLRAALFRAFSARRATGTAFKRFEERHGLAVIVEGDAGVDEALQALLVRAVSELLFNVSEHAGTDYATMKASQDGGAVRIVVAGDGVGFDPVQGKEVGFGLTSVQRRLTSGSLDIESRPGHGTRDTLVSPTGFLDSDS